MITFERMEIVFNIDDGYVQPCAATLNSVVRHNPGETIAFHLLTTGLSADNEALLADLAGRAGHRLTVWRIAPSRVEGMPNLSERDHVKAAAYLRVFMAEILPNTVEKVLYLDCDLLVRAPLRPLWETDLRGFALAAVEDAPAPGLQEKLGYSGTWPYFNSGVMLVDLRYWREKGMQQRMIDWLSHNAGRMVHHDQDVLNAVLHGNVRLVDVGWNLMKCFFRDPPRIDPKYLEILPERRREPMIVHFTGRDKPWNSRMYHPFAREYFDCLRGTPWEGFRLTAREICRQRGFKGLLANVFEQFGRRLRRRLKSDR